MVRSGVGVEDRGFGDLSEGEYDAGRSEVAEDADLPRVRSVGDFARDLRRGAVDVGELVGLAVLFEYESVRAERVRENDVGARVRVRLDDLADEVGVGKIEQVGVGSGGRSEPLKFRAHSAVEYDRAFIQ